MTRYWLDTEFIEDGRTIDLISIGIVAEDGREYYRQNLEFNEHKASLWVAERVFPYLQQCDSIRSYQGVAAVGCKGLHAWRCSEACPWGTRLGIAREIIDFCDPERFGEPEFWGYYADYDWVALCQLFGTMMDLPKGWPMYCRDLKQLCDDLGNPSLPEQGKGEHHALADARWNRQAWEFLRGLRAA